MGARRNDDADIQLRDDHLLPSREVPSSPMATHEVSPSPAVEKATKSGGVATYFPFGFIYYSTKNDKKNSGNRNGNEQVGDAPVGPPVGAFPPPIGENGNTDEIRREVNDLNEYVASHPWYHQSTLVEEEDGGICDEAPGMSNNNGGRFPSQNTNHSPGKNDSNSSQWQDQKDILSTTFNFTNAIIGAGAMGLGGAFAASGGGISIICLLGFAYLTKLSLDLIVDLSSSPEIVKIVQDLYGNEVAYESEYDDEEEMHFDQADSEMADDALQPLEEAEHDQHGSSSTPDQTDEQNTSEKSVMRDGSTTKDGEETALIANKRETSPLMAQEPTIDEHIPATEPNPHEVTELDKNRYDSLNSGLSPNHQLQLLNIDSDGNPVLNIQSTSTAQLNDEATFQPCTYEEVGRAAYGTKGRLAVLISKCLYSFGCLVAYVVVVRDNAGEALRRIIYKSSQADAPTWLQDDDYLTFWISAFIMLPLSCPRTMEPLAKFSFVSVVSIMFLALSVVYLYFSCTDPVASTSTFYENWIEIRSFSGFFESLGTFVFTFVCHHVVNNAYESLPPKLRNTKTWRTVSTNSIVMSTEASMAIGLFAYMTFGAGTPADVLLAYPSDMTIANISRLLLCLTMVLTFPLPFLTCREMLVLIMVDTHRFYYINGLARFNIFSRLLGFITLIRRKLWTLLYKDKSNDKSNHRMQTENDPEEPADAEVGFMEMQHPVPVRTRLTNWGKRLWIFNQEKGDDWWDPAEPFLSDDEAENPLLDSSIGGMKGEAVNPSPLSSPDPSLSSSEESYSEESMEAIRVPAPHWLQKNGNGRQLSFLWHATFTFLLWIIATMSAIKAPSLGDVLDLVGAFTGTLLAFVLPALFAFKLKGYTNVSCAILAIGGFVGVCGTISSMVKLVSDIRD